MARTRLEDGIAELHDGVRLLYSRADKAITDSMDALQRRDLAVARGVVEGDATINAERYAIEEKVIDLMARQAPVASDLREMVSMLSIVTELERIADHAEGIARIALFLKDNPIASEEPALWEMKDKAQGMLRLALTSFVEKDEARARAACDLDDEVDELYTVINQRLVQRLASVVAHDAGEFDAVTHVIWCSHNLERIGDRATNIAERAIFLVTGKLTEINVSSY
jgi:phosphate transport system protein